MRYALVFGKNWKLSLAESLAFLELREPSWNFVDLCDGAMIIDAKTGAGEIINGLGGTLKVACVEKQFDFANLGEQDFGEGREERLSFYGNNDLGRQLKKVFPNVAPHKEYSATELVRHDMSENTLVWGMKTCYFGPTVAVADYRSFRKRDESRPLHPPLGIAPSRARILVNLSQARDFLLDPFCGYGTILQEALLSGVKNVYGSDIDGKAVNGARKNLEWAKKTRRLESTNFSLKQCDARRLDNCWSSAEAIATEPELGPKLGEQPSQGDARKIISFLEDTYYRFFQSARKLLPPHGRVAIAFPAINSRKGKVFVEKRFPGFRPADLFWRVPERYREHFGLRMPFVIDEEREPGKRRVVAREFTVLERI
ncbi:hypothetical protein HYS54_02120 [Candidatus Micrarchaeota archaeon]|nr:hypothetical protein [Candidatus Micrarchaeota archaeon]